MKISIRLIFAALFILALGAGTFSYAMDTEMPEGTALQLLRTKELELRKILGVASKEGTPAHDEKKKKIKNMIDELFDFEELGKRSLGRHWKPRTPEERKDFLVTLRALVEKNYLMRIADQTTYTSQFFGEVKGKDGPEVRLRVTSGVHKYKMEFKLFEREGKLFIFDMVIDDVSVVRNYRSQFNRIVKKEGFPALMEKMKKKLNEEEGANKDVHDKL